MWSMNKETEKAFTQKILKGIHSSKSQIFKILFYPVQFVVLLKYCSNDDMQSTKMKPRKYG